MCKGFVVLLLVLLEVIIAGGVFAEASDSMPDSTDCAAWVDSLRNEGLALPRHEVLALARDPLPAGSPLPGPSQRYDELLQAIERKRAEFSTTYRKASSDSERSRVVEEAGEHIEAIIGDLLFPSWLGVEWGFFGVPARTPLTDRPVACGHFVQKLLEDAGFKTQKRAGTWLAYLSPDDLIHSVQGRPPEDLAGWDGAKAYLDAHGPGLYVLGLECGWGHIGWLRQGHDSSLWFLHSGPHFSGASVSIDDGEHYLRDFVAWEHLWMARVDSTVVIKWLEGTAIVPCVVMD